MRVDLRPALAITLCTILLGACTPAPVQEQPPSIAASETAQPETSLTARATTLVEQMASGQFAAVFATFDNTMAAAMPASGLSTVWTQLQQTAGPFKSHTSAREAKEAGYDVVYVACTFERASLNAKVVFGKDGKVSGLFFQP
jgi:hypothetical protein